MIYALFVLVGLGAMPARSEGAGSGTYEAYWLTNKAHGEYVKLVLTRRPLSDLPHFSPPANHPISECDAVIRKVRRLLLGVSNPSPYGPPLRLAKQAQDRHQPGWPTRGEVSS